MRNFTMMRTVLPLFAVSLFGLSACSGEEPGNALPTDSAVSTESSPASDKQSPQTDAATASLDPCSLLGPSDLAEFGTFGDGESKQLGGARGCSFYKELDSASDDTLTIGVAIRDSQGVAEVRDQGNGIETGTVSGDREAAQTSGGSACLIALAVGENSRVDIGVTATYADKVCKIADAVAAIVEPKLPEG